MSFTWLTEIDLPSGWECMPIRDTYEFTQKPRGLNVKQNGGVIPFFTMAQIPLGRVTVSEYTAKPADKLGSGTYVENGDVMVAKITPSFENGKQAIVDIESAFAYATTEVIPLRAIEEKADNLYLFFYLLHPEIRANLAGKMEGSTGRQRLSKEVLGDCLIPLPPLPEQKKIAHVLSTVQRAIEQQERIIVTTTELKKALMQRLFTEGLRGEPPKQTEIGPVPESWELVELTDVINLFAGYAFKSKEGIPESNTQLLRMGNLYQNSLDLSRKPIFYPDEFVERHKRFVLKEGDLVMSLTGTSGKEDYGFTVKLPKTDKILLLNQRVARVEVTDSRLQKDFVLHFLLSRKFLDFLYPTAKGMKQANLSTHAMKKLKVPLPSWEEQENIAACFNTLDRKIAVAEQKVATLQDLFRTLLYELMTAKIRVNEMDFSGRAMRRNREGI